MNDYQPISCKLHSQYELLAMQQRTINLLLKERSLVGKIQDIFTRKRVEYLVLQMTDENTQEIRLDSIVSFEIAD
ncbi:MAG: Rho-binding antiterminator [Sedimenticola sp.]